MPEISRGKSSVPELVITSRVPDLSVTDRGKSVLISDLAVPRDEGWGAWHALPASSIFGGHMTGCSCCRPALAELLGQLAQKRLLGQGLMFDRAVVIVPEAELSTVMALVNNDILVRARYGCVSD